MCPWSTCSYILCSQPGREISLLKGTTILTRLRREAKRQTSTLFVRCQLGEGNESCNKHTDSSNFTKLEGNDRLLPHTLETVSRQRYSRSVNSSRVLSLLLSSSLSFSLNLLSCLFDKRRFIHSSPSNQSSYRSHLDRQHIQGQPTRFAQRSTNTTLCTDTINQPTPALLYIHIPSLHEISDHTSKGRQIYPYTRRDLLGASYTQPWVCAKTRILLKWEGIAQLHFQLSHMPRRNEAPQLENIPVNA